MTQGTYEKRVVLFLDILGFRDLVKNHREAEILDALSIPKELAGHYPFDGSTHMELSAFSDSIVVSERIISNFNVQRMIGYSAFLYLRFLAKGILTRGGIALGNLHHRDGVVFGPALNEAYQLESELAFYPRIVISNTSYIAAMQAVEENESVHSKTFLQMVRHDFDGVVHVNTLGSLSLMPREALPTKPTPPPGLPTSYSVEEIENAKAVLVSKVLEKKPVDNPRIKAKYDWLQRYFENRHNLG